MPLSKLEVALMSESGIAPEAIPRGAVHCAATEEKSQRYSQLKTRVPLISGDDFFSPAALCRVSVYVCGCEYNTSRVCLAARGGMRLIIFFDADTAVDALFFGGQFFFLGARITRCCGDGALGELNRLRGEMRFLLPAG